MGATKKLFADYNQKLINKLIPQKSEPIETYFTIDPNEEIFNKSFNQIEKEMQESRTIFTKQGPVFVYGKWYCPKNGFICFETDDELVDGIDIEQLNDNDQFSCHKIKSLEDLINAVNY